MNNLISISGKLSSGKDSVAIIIQGLELSLDEDQIIHAVRQQTYFNSSNWEIKRFADKLKDTVCLWLGCSREQLEDREFKEKPLGEEWDKWGVSYNCPTSEVQKIFGTHDEALKHAKSLGASDKILTHFDVIRKIQMTPRKLMQLLGTEAGREIIHPSIWVNATFSEWEDNQNWIIPDMRLPNETNAVKNRDGILIRVQRDRWKRLGVERGETIPVSDKETHLSETALDDYNDWDYVLENNGTIMELVNKVKTIMQQESIL